MKTLVRAIKDRYSVRNMVRRSQHEVGATAIEYLLLAACVSVVLLTFASAINFKLQETFGTLHAISQKK